MLLIMREEATLLLNQAKKDFEAGIVNLNNNLLFVAAFLFQQAAEKSLKALWITKLKKLPPLTHNLVRLAEELGANENIIKCAKILTPHAILSRYPTRDFAPYEIYTKEEVEELKSCAEQIIKWTEEQLKSLER